MCIYVCCFLPCGIVDQVEDQGEHSHAKGRLHFHEVLLGVGAVHLGQRGPFALVEALERGLDMIQESGIFPCRRWLAGDVLLHVFAVGDCLVRLLPAELVLERLLDGDGAGRRPRPLGTLPRVALGLGNPIPHLIQHAGNVFKHAVLVEDVPVLFRWVREERALGTPIAEWAVPMLHHVSILMDLVSHGPSRLHDSSL